jgi:hypothetical protein
MMYGIPCIWEPEDDVTIGWFIQRENSKDQWLHIRGGRYIEWTKNKDEALQFHRAEDARKFAEFFFGSALHGHDIVAYGGDISG